MLALLRTSGWFHGFKNHQSAPGCIAAAAIVGTGVPDSSAHFTADGSQQLSGVFALVQCFWASGNLLGSGWQIPCRFCTSSSASDSSSCSNSSSSTLQQTLRSGLGNGSALGSIRLQQPDSDPAKRRESLLSKSGRFYETVQIKPYHKEADLPHSYQLLLRKYPIKTPAKNVLVLPTRSLALAIAAEWEWLPKGKPVPHLMPLMSLAATAIDQPKERLKVIEHLLKYVHTDGACIRYEPGALERRQKQMFDPLLHWALEKLGWQLATSHSIFGTTQNDETVAAVESWLQGLDKWQLAAADQLITSSKSVVIAAALLHRRINVDEAVAAARIEEDFQLEDWGMVEAGHDLDIADTKSRLGAPAVFARLLSQP